MSLEDALRTLAVPHAAQDSKVAAASSLLRQCTEQPDHVLDVIRYSTCEAANPYDSLLLTPHASLPHPMWLAACIA